MEQAQDPVIAGLMSRIRDIEQRALELKRAVNSLNKENGEPLTYQNGELALSDVGGSLSIKSDQFYGQKIHTAMRQYLAMRKAANLGPATLPQIYQALRDGGLKFETTNEDNRKTNMRFLLRKNTSIFHRLPDKIHFALSEWYPNLKDGDQDGNAKKTKSKGRRTKSVKKQDDDRKSVKTESPSGKKPSAKHDAVTSAVSGLKVTQEQAVRAALDAVTGKFKRQDIVDWIEENHPSIHAQQKRDSIFAMLSKLKDEIELVDKGKGAEPSTYRKVHTAKAK